MGILFHAKTIGSLNNKPLVFLHGFLGSHVDFIPLAQLLSKYFYCILIDLPGHGDTRVLGDLKQYTIEETCVQLEQFLREMGVCDYYTVGYSMGGRYAFELHTQSKHVKSSVVFAAHPGLSCDVERQERRKQEQLIIHKIQTDKNKFLKEWYEQPLFEGLKSSPQFPQVFHRRQQGNALGWVYSLRYAGLSNQQDYVYYLRQTTKSLCYVYGDLDSKYQQIAKELLLMSSYIKSHSISHVGHAIPFEVDLVYLAKLIHNSVEICAK